MTAFASRPSLARTFDDAHGIHSTGHRRGLFCCLRTEESGREPGVGDLSELAGKDATNVHTGWVATTTLYRPVGQPELDLIAASDWRRFPPRLDWQPIFYPVTNEPYATRIARDWNTKDDQNGNVGYVLRFEVDSGYLSQFDVQQVGDNDHIVGALEVISEWRADP